MPRTFKMFIMCYQLFENFKSIGVNSINFNLPVDTSDAHIRRIRLFVLKLLYVLCILTNVSNVH